MKKTLWIALGFALTSQLSGCAALVVGAAAGGVAGYEAAKHGYTVQSPIAKKSDPANPRTQ